MTQPYRIGFLLWPGLTQLDMTGPAQVLSRMPGAELHFVWKSLEPQPSDCGLPLVPTMRMSHCPQLDMICVPGGAPVAPIMRDAEVLDWLRKQAAGAKLVTSVCTGSLILAAAGLLEGYKAGCYWASGHQLPLFGAEFVAERTVIDRDRITAGGVTSGIDFAFRVIEHLHGRDMAEAVQLALEYDPAPLAGGTPATARPEIVERVRAMMAARIAQREAEIADIAAHRHA
ncbi:MAG: DJ-1/PfpI family protein [Alphaproteobacteria bacterium]|nr:DJ-1/PfpI family protein [Alphaproteobacteria bacterium]